MRSGIRIVAGIGFVALIVAGMIQPVEHEVRWLLCLWGAVPFLAAIAWASRSAMPRGLNRSVHNLGLVIAIGFVLLSLQLLRQQIVQASATYYRVQVDPESGQVTSNVRPVLDSQRVIRGTIFDRTGIELVQSEVVDEGFARRVYPVANAYNPAAFSNIVGFFSNRFGQSGLEATYNDYLNGERGNVLARLQKQMLGEPQEGSHLHLSLDARLQARAWELLGGSYGSVVVLNPRSGAVLAMASTPGFDPRGLSFDYAVEDWIAEHQRVSQFWSQITRPDAGQPLLNRPTQGQYPPGSTFKTVTAVAALRYPDIATPNTIRCMDEYKPEPGAPPVVNAVRHGLSSYTGDPATLERVYAYSCNVAFAQYAVRLGADRLTHQAELFDIYAPHNAPEVYDHFTDLVTMPGLLYVEPAFLDRLAALADTGYGQGQLLVTPLQMAMVAAAIANDGVMMHPYLVERIMPPEGETPLYERLPQEIRRTMSPEIAKKMRDNMRAVGEYGFGSVVNTYAPPGVVFGGKSGTGEHVPGATPHAWFIAIAPVDEPRYAVAVMVERGGEGSTIAAQLAGQVLRAAFDLE